jgi:O-antigen biosynthesis alpha-1,2-rhamnosyltransferase
MGNAVIDKTVGNSVESRRSFQDATKPGQLKLIVDHSQTALTSRNTGIERVVRCIVSHLPDCVGDNKLVCGLHLDGDFFALDDELQSAMKSLGEFEQKASQSYPVPLRKLLATVTKNRPFHKLQKVLLPAPSHLGIFKLPHSFLVYLAKQSRRRRGGEITPNEKTILLLPDAYWTKMDVWPTVARYRADKCFVCTVVYDLIPISHPEFVGERRAEKFRKYINCVIRNSDLIIAISDTVKQDISRYIQENYVENETVCQSIASFQLGADVPAVSGTVRERTATLFVKRTANSPYLVVGLTPAKITTTCSTHSSFFGRMDPMRSFASQAESADFPKI